MKRLLWSLLLVPMLAFAGSINPGRDIQGFKPNTNGSGPASGVSTVGTLTSTQLTSTISTGTAPLVVASTTTVANLSAATATTATTATNLLGGTVQGTQLGFQTGAGVGGTASSPYGIGATLNKMGGQITIQASNYSAGNQYYVNVYDSNVTANDVVVASWAPGSVSNAVLWTEVYAGVVTINFYIFANSATGQSNYINFVVIKNSIN